MKDFLEIIIGLSQKYLLQRQEVKREPLDMIKKKMIF